MTLPTIPASSSKSAPEARYLLDALHRAQQGQPSDDPILLALNDAQRRYTIPAGLLDELAMGTSMDVIDPVTESQAPTSANSAARNSLFKSSSI